MIFLRTFGGPIIEDYLLLKSIDVPVILVAIACIFIVYAIIRKRKLNKRWESNITDEMKSVEIIPRDVLMQPKKVLLPQIENEPRILFTNFSLTNVYVLLGIMFVLILVLSLIFENKFDNAY